MLSPSILARSFTAEQIQAKIDLLSAAYEAAAENVDYSLNDNQSQQFVRNQKIDKLSAELNNWLKAKDIQNGTAGAKFYVGHFTGTHD